MARRTVLPFDREGGTIAFSKRMIESKAWLHLSAQAKVLLVHMQLHWRPDEPVGYGIREAMAKIPCAKGTAQRAFAELQAAGFIRLVDESLFNSREQSKTRTWRLTWMPWQRRPPTKEWEKIEPTGSNTHHLVMPQGQKCTPSKAANGPQGQKCTLNGHLSTGQRVQI